VSERILAVGAHPDDIELGCGATLALHVAAGAEVTMLVMTSGAAGPGNSDVRAWEAREAAATLGAEIILAGLADSTLTPEYDTVQVIENAIEAIDPMIIYTHAESDSHQDHRATAQATISAARQRPSVLHYQSPSSRAFNPSLYVDIEDFLPTKLAALAFHRSQVAESPMVDLDAQAVNAAYWGRQARCRYAEPFEVTRVLVRIGDRNRLGLLDR
jgi:LmbE family N-acetylglucosaminyl deacetylase